MPDRIVSDDMNFTFKLRDVILFVWMFLLFIFSWISVAVVGRAIDNITFTTLKLSDKSTLHTVVIAMVIVSIEILTLYYFNSLGMNLYGDSIVPCLQEETDKEETNKDVNDKRFLDSMNILSMIAKIEGICII